MNKEFNKSAATLALIVPLLLNGCAGISQRDAFIGLGVTIGAATGAVLTNKSNSDVRNLGIIVGGAAGAAAGAVIAPECEGGTSTQMGRPIYGNQTGPWQGNQTHSQHCNGTQPGNPPTGGYPVAPAYPQQRY